MFGGEQRTRRCRQRRKPDGEQRHLGAGHQTGGPSHVPPAGRSRDQAGHGRDRVVQGHPDAHDMRTGRHRIQRSPLTAPASVGADLSAPRPDPGQLRPGHRLAPRLHRAPRRRRRAVGTRRGPPAAGRLSVPAHRSRHLRRWTSRPVGLDHAAHPDRADHGYRSARGRLTGARRPLADSDARPGMSASRSTPGRTPLNYLPETAVLPAAAARRSTGG